MKAVVLAAGRGRRMGGGTENLPKCLMTLWGRTLLDHCLGGLQKAGFSPRDIGIVTGYRREMLDAPGFSYFQNAEWESTNMFVSLTTASEWLRSEACVVSYSDIVFSPDAVMKLVASARELSITYYAGFWELWSERFQNPLDDLETFKQLGGNLLEIGKKPVSKEDVQGQYMGLLRFEPSGWDKVERAVKLPMPKTVDKLDMTTLLQHLIDLGCPVEAIETGGPWFECDNMNDIEVYERLYPSNPVYF